MRRDTHDPYAPPPPHKERSGAIVRFAIVAALLGAAAWGYMEYYHQPQSALVEPANEQTVADSGYRMTTPPPEAGQTPQSTTPAEVPEKVAEPPA
jgi:hypothetical protein